MQKHLDLKRGTVLPIDPATLVKLPSAIGVPRFTPYLSQQNNVQTEAIRLYAWIVEAAAAILGSYAVLEVGVRNAMHNRLSTLFGRDDWWSAAPLAEKDVEQIDEVKSYLARRKAPGSWSTGHVVAELKTSFWEGLLVNRYHRSFWELGLKNAFPGYSGRRADLRERMERLRLLRNRAAHHEPIFARDLSIDHKYMCELAGFIEPDLETWIASHSRLPGIILGRGVTITGSRPTRF